MTVMSCSHIKSGYAVCFSWCHQLHCDADIMVPAMTAISCQLFTLVTHQNHISSYPLIKSSLSANASNYAIPPTMVMTLSCWCWDAHNDSNVTLIIHTDHTYKWNMSISIDRLIYFSSFMTISKMVHCVHQKQICPKISHLCYIFQGHIWEMFVYIYIYMLYPLNKYGCILQI